MRKSIIIFLLISICQCLLAQIPLSYSNNQMRSGDFLCKVVVDYVDAGESGPNKVWMLGQITDHSKNYYQGIVSCGDTIALFEKGCIQHYFMHGDTLCYKGNQQRRSYRLYDIERPVLRYPFAYGDSISGHYIGEGIDENYDLTIDGWGYSVADGMGILTNGEDTLHNVMRLHMFDEYVENYDNKTEIHLRNDHFLWYCAGYRYPVMESFRRLAIEDGATEVPLDSVTYLFLPAMQSSLGEDAANYALLNQLTGDQGQDNMQNGNIISSLSDVHAELSANGRSLNVSYSLSSESDLSFYAFDIIGNILGSFHSQNKETGQWQECIPLSRIPVANVLMLNIRCNEETTSIKVNY